MIKKHSKNKEYNLKALEKIMINKYRYQWNELKKKTRITNCYKWTQLNIILLKWIYNVKSAVIYSL